MKLSRWLALCLISLMITLFLGSCSSSLSAKVVVLNFGATSMVRSVLEEIDPLYQQEHPNVWVSHTFAAAGTIQTAVERKEAFDGVLFADISYLDALQTQRLILPESRQKLLTTDIVVIAPSNSALQMRDLRDLASDKIETVAIGKPNLAVGKYSHTILSRLGIDQAVESKAVWATVDVREVLRAVELGDAQVGITFLPEAKAFANVKVLATAPRNLYEPIQSGAAVVKSSAHPQQMQAYIDFLTSKQAMAIFEKFGLRSLQHNGK